MKSNSSSKFTFQILVFALLVVLFGSCKNDDSDTGSEYYVRFNANGQKVEYTIHNSLVAAFGQSGIQYNAVFTGYDATSNISLQVYDNKAIVPATFTGYSLSGSTFVGALIGYQDKTGTLYTQGAVTPNSTITITEITSAAVRGTFNGTVKAAGKSDISITSGEFYVWRAN
jgi:hypothetical protein